MADEDPGTAAVIEELCRLLAQDPDIVLETPSPIGLDTLREIAARADAPEEPMVNVVVVGHSSVLLDKATELPGSLRHILVAFDDDSDPSVSVSDVPPENIAKLIHAIIVAGAVGEEDGAGEDLPTAQVIDLNLRLGPDPVPSGREAAADAGEKAAGEPQAPANDAPAPPTCRVDQWTFRSLRAAMTCFEDAVGCLTAISRHRGGEDSVYGPSWSALESWRDQLSLLDEQPKEPRPSHSKEQNEALARWNRFADLTAALVEPRSKLAKSQAALERMFEDPLGAETPLSRLAALLGYEREPILLAIAALAPELSMSAQRLYGAYHDDFSRRHLSLSLACVIIAACREGEGPRRIRARLGANEILRELRIIDGMGDTLPTGDEPLRLDPPLREWLLTGDETRLTANPAFQSILRPIPADAAALIPPERRSEIEALALPPAGPSGKRAFDAAVLTGSEPGWIEAETILLAGAELRIGPPAAEMPAETLHRVLREAVRTSRCCRKRLVVDMIEPGAQGESFWRALAPLLPRCGPLPFAISDNPAWLMALTANERLAVVPLPPVRQAHRIAAIRAVIDPDVAGERALAAELAERFRVPLLVLPDVPPLARAEAARVPDLDRPGPDEWKTAFRNVAGSRIPEVARRIPPRPDRPGRALDRVVLPDAQRRQLEAIVRHMRVGGTVLRDWGFGELFDTRGVSALFSGDSGTGKTLAAHAIASELGTDLYVVDLGQVVSKYIGETEKNLNLVFSIAEQSGACLLFDEADALFGKRSAVSDAVGRYANMEVAYLLQRIVAFDGLAILTTNLPENIDPAFDRRMRFTIPFPRPSAKDRLAICDLSLPRGRRRHHSVDFTLFTRRIDLTGGEIVEGVIVPALINAAADPTADDRVWPRHLREATIGLLTRLGRFDELRQVGELFPDPREREAA